MITHVLDHFIGEQIKDCASQITAVAQSYGYTVNVMDPEINKDNSVMSDPHRLNIHLDRDFVIKCFTVG